MANRLLNKQFTFFSLSGCSETLIIVLNHWSKCRRRKWMEEDRPRCEKCGNFIDDCKCVCPYCGETDGCTCCIGNDKTTGG